LRVVYYFKTLALGVRKEDLFPSETLVLDVLLKVEL